MRGMAFTLSLLAIPLWAQSGITGPAGVTLNDAGLDCNGFARVVEVVVDVTGLSGVGGPAGLNSFVLVFNLSRSDVFASAAAGSNPDLDWYFLATDRNGVNASNSLRLVSSVADLDAPNQRYQVASILLSGLQGGVTLTFNAAESSLGSRYINGDGPGPISISGSPPLTVSIPIDFNLDIGTGVSYWLTESVEYDMAPPVGNINVLDLVKMVLCGAN